MTYDGYGRLKTQHRPEQQAITNNSASSDHTTFNYNADDTISHIVDARGAITNYTYNSRHLLTGITYDISNIPAPFNYVTTTAAQSFAYDGAGNRTSMTDGTGTTNFQYNSLSQLSSETRYFAGPFAATPYTLSYTYNLAGEITSLVLPSQFGTNLTYGYDAVGRLSSLTGSGYSYTNSSNTQVPVTSFLSNAVYRAWNDLKQMNTGSSSQTSFAYNANLQPVSYNLTAGASSYTWNYQYYADGSTRMVSDAADNRFDKAYAYDHVGRMTEAYSGREARGLAVSTPIPDSAFRQSFAYNAFNHQVSETGRIWQREISGQMFSFTNNRRLDLMYDAAGHVIADAQGSHVFDAAGHRVLATAGTTGGGETGHPEMPAEERAVTYDGDGQPTRNTLITRSEILVGDGPQTFISSHTEITYYLRSTVLGGYVVGELNNLGQKSKQYIYAGGERLLEHSTSGGFNTINWQHRNPLTDSWIAVDPHGLASFRTEVDAHGRETGIEAPIILSSEPSPPPQTRSPSYLEMQGGATIEAESGMQLYEDVYLNSFFKEGNGPGEGGYDRLRTLREFQLSLGVKFALSMSWLDLKNRENYEPVLDYVTRGLEGSENGRRINHYQLKPGTQQRGKAGSSENEEPQDPFENTKEAQAPNDCLILAAMVDIYAEEASSDSTFVSTLYNRFKDRNNLTFLARGFRQQFVDNDSPNQARHAVGAIAAGYAGGIAALAGGPATYEVALKATLGAFNSRERAYTSYNVTGAVAPGIPSTGHVGDPQKDNQADINLNGVAVPIGFALGVGHIRRRDIGNLIRGAICEPPSP